MWAMYRQMSTVQRSASRAEGKAERVADRIRMLEDKIDSLALVCQGIWELLSESVPDAENALIEKVKEIDMRDGKLDGKMGRIQTHCSQCDRPLHKRHKKCLYCGHLMDGEHVFQK